MEQEYTYGVARVRALEGRLFSDDTINQLMSCGTYEDAIAFLKNKGWGKGGENETLEDILNYELNDTWRTLHEIVKDKLEYRILTIENEFHNLKAAIKQVCTEEDAKNIFYEDSSINLEFLQTCIKQSKYELLPEPMPDIARKATETLLQSGDGQLCDVVIDKACLEEIKKAGDEASNQLLKDYADMKVTIADIKIAVRCASTNKTGEFVEKALVKCDGVSVTDLVKAVDKGLDGVFDYLENAGYKDAVSAYKESASVFECWCDNQIIEKIKFQKYNSFTIGPIVAYVLARENEIKTVKIILSGKLNGFSEEFIKERVRVMYA